MERGSARGTGGGRGGRMTGAAAGRAGLLACGASRAGLLAGRAGALARGASRAGLLVWVAGLLAGGAGCSSGAHSDVAAAGATCGSTRTAVDVPVLIKVAKGTVNCGVAMQVENDYAAKVRDGQVAGNGGGAPVKVDGWTCQGYSTPELLRTGIASQCHAGSAAIVAVLPPVPTPTATGTAG